MFPDNLVSNTMKKANGTAHATAPARGRPRSFDRDAALERAMQVFWRQGYEATSVSDLTRAMGINPPSLYAAFGDKEQLYLAALERYEQERRESVVRILEEAPSARQAIERLLEEAASEMASGEVWRGCVFRKRLPAPSAREKFRGSIGPSDSSSFAARGAQCAPTHSRSCRLCLRSRGPPTRSRNRPRIERCNHTLSEKCDVLPMNFASIGAMTLAIGGDTEVDATMSTAAVVVVGDGVARRSSGNGVVAINSCRTLA